MPAWPASIQPMVIQEELVKNPECYNVSAETILEKKKKKMFSFYGSRLRYIIPIYFFKKITLASNRK